MRQHHGIIAAALVAAACANPPTTATVAAVAPLPAAAPPAGAPSAPRPAIDPANLDPAVRAQDDLYRHVNGGWVERTQIPADKASYGAFVILRDRTLDDLHRIVDDLAAQPALADPEAAKVRDFYGSFMDQPRRDALALGPLAASFADVDAVRDKSQIPVLMARFAQMGVSSPFVPDVEQDARDSTRYVVSIRQAGLGMPDRDYYLRDDDAKLVAVRKAYRAYVERMLGIAGAADAAPAMADQILDLETRLARAQWTRVETRDPVKRYNPYELAKLPALAPGFDWARYLAAGGAQGRIDRIIVNQPSYVTAFAKLLDELPLDTWKSYMMWRVLDGYAPFLSTRIVDESFAFHGTAVSGTPQNRPAWQRALGVVENNIGEDLGKLYVERYFTPDRKARMDALVANLLAAYRTSIDGLDWMGPETKKAALGKLATFAPHIGYPSRWRDYSRVEVRRGDLVGNVMRAQRFEYERNLAKLGKPVDREEWLMTPQTVNAYYYPPMNEIVFPAAILQPPFFDAAADEAYNYGAIGAVIGHEISHGFDDRGSQYDGQGNLREWWTTEDRARFKERTAKLVAQYGGYSPLPGYQLNGELTLGENIADTSGLAIAWKAYKISLGGKEPPVLDGLTGAQRFYYGWAHVWAEKRRDEERIRLLKIDPHSPGPFRADGAASNQESFYAAFGVKEGDGMYLPPERRVRIW